MLRIDVEEQPVVDLRTLGGAAQVAVKRSTA